MLSKLELKYLLSKACVDVLRHKDMDDETRLIAATAAVGLTKNGAESDHRSMEQYTISIEQLLHTSKAVH